MRWIRAAFLASLALASPALARVEVTLDADSVNDLLRSMAPDRVDVGLAAGRSVTLLLQDLKVTGFDPSAGANGGLTASLELRVPELGLDLPLAPRLTLEMTDGAAGGKACVLRFQQVVLNLPLTGPVDVAALFPALPVVPESDWLIRSARGDVRVKPVLLDAKTGVKNIRLGFDLKITPAAP